MIESNEQRLEKKGHPAEGVKMASRIRIKLIK